MSSEREPSRWRFDFRASTKIAKRFAVVLGQFCACAQKKSCRGPLGCPYAHAHAHFRCHGHGQPHGPKTKRRHTASRPLAPGTHPILNPPWRLAALASVYRHTRARKSASEMHPASWRVQRRPTSRIFRRRARRVTGLRRGPPALGLAGPSGRPAGPPGRCGNTSLDAALEVIFDCIRGPGVPGGLAAPR